MAKHSSKLERQVDGGKVVVHESGQGGMRKIRTPDHQLAVPTRARDGSTVYTAPNGKSYRVRPMK